MNVMKNMIQHVSIHMTFHFKEGDGEEREGELVKSHISHRLHPKLKDRRTLLFTL